GKGFWRSSAAPGRRAGSSSRTSLEQRCESARGSSNACRSARGLSGRRHASFGGHGGGRRRRTGGRGRMTTTGGDWPTRPRRVPVLLGDPPREIPCPSLRGRRSANSRGRDRLPNEPDCQVLEGLVSEDSI